MKRRLLIRWLALAIALLTCQASGFAGTGAAGLARAEEGKLEAMFAEAYKSAYEKEYASLDDYIYSFSANFDPNEYRRRKTRNMTQPLQEIATESYNFMVDNYPGVAGYYADQIGRNFGGLAPLVSDAAYSLFTDPEAGSLFGELIAGAAEFLTAYDYATRQANKNPHPEYAEYALVTERYTLLKSSGTAQEILEKHSGAIEDIKVKLLALEERKLVLQESHNRLMWAFQQVGEQEGYFSESPEMVEITLNLQISNGMLQAVEDKYEALSQQKNQATSDLLSRFTGPSNDLSGESCLYNIIDNQTGEVLGAFCAIPKLGDFIWRVNTAFRVNKAGMVSVYRKIYDLPLSILDKNGQLLYQSSDDCAYGNLTPCGNLLRVSRQTSVDYGDHLLIEIVAPNGALLAVVGHARPDALYFNETHVSANENNQNGRNDDDNALPTVLSELPFRDDVYIRFTEADGKEKKGLLDLSTCKVKKIKFDESMKQDTAILLSEPTASKAGNSYIVGSTGYTQINKSYKLDNAKSIVYGPNGLEIDLSKIGSGVKAIHQDRDGRYWVITKSGFYYVLNGNWKARFKEPVQLGNDVKFEFTNEGLLAETSEGLSLYDMDGERLRTIEGVTLDSQRGDYVGSNVNGWFNVNTGEVMLVTLPERGVSVLE